METFQNTFTYILPTQLHLLKATQKIEIVILPRKDDMSLVKFEFESYFVNSKFHLNIYLDKFKTNTKY